MKPLILLLALSFASVMSAKVDATPPPVQTTAPANGGCMEHAQTQMDMDQCAASDSHAADTELNSVYQQVLKKYASDKVFIAKFKAAQRAWLTYRDAELAARFPEDDKGSAYGSIYPVCANNEIEAMTRQRTEELRQWLKGTEEGDTCAGSYQVAPGK